MTLEETKAMLDWGLEEHQHRICHPERVGCVFIASGFNTAKGDLVRSILYPKPMNFKLYRDAIRFLLCLVGTATIGMIYTLCVYVLSGVSCFCYMYIHTHPCLFYTLHVDLNLGITNMGNKAKHWNWPMYSQAFQHKQLITKVHNNNSI